MSIFHNINLRICEILLSLPSRERGLKFMCLLWCDMLVLVAPFAGAWIEIAVPRPNSCFYLVAPFAGAWIEMPCKLFAIEIVIVAPFAGAWIEIFFSKSDSARPRSLPSRERGLKSLFLSI